MRILYISSDPDNPPQGNKGASVHIREMVRAFENLGNEVRIITTAGKSEGNILRVEPVKKKWLGKDVSRLLTQFKIIPFLLKETLKFQPRLIYERYDLYAFGGVIVARLLHIPHFLELNAPLRWGPRRRINFPGLATLMEYLIFFLTDRIILTTGNLKEYIYPGFRSKLRVVPDGADEETFYPFPPDEGLGRKLGLGKKVVGFVGSFSPRQGLPLLISALPPEACLLLVGEGRERRKLESLVEGKKVIFTGEVPHRDIPRYISLMDVCVLPDISIYSSPVKLFEYMAMGKPVVAPSKGQIKELFEDGKELLLFPPGDKEKLGARIKELLENRSLREELGRKARERFLQEFTWKKQAEKVLGEICDIISSRKPGWRNW